jgi:hypothetical protein
MLAVAADRLDDPDPQPANTAPALAKMAISAPPFLNMIRFLQSPQASTSCSTEPTGDGVRN